MDSLHFATSIVNKLVRAGYIAYFAGGWVRDFVMGHPSEDIDIATSAPPIEVMNLFPHTVLVGLQFGVVIVPLGGHQFEVATFRKDLKYTDGRHPEGIEMSTPLEDALRRDFTINGMFYDPIEHVIHDFVHGADDIKKGIIRTIGNPHERFDEDRLRMLRAFRFEARFGFAIELETQDAITENANRLFPAVAIERVWQEFNKMAAYPRFDHAIVEMHRLRLLEVIFPELKQLHLTQLQSIVSSFERFPKNCPVILYLMTLFPHESLNTRRDIAIRLTAPNRDIKLLEFFEQVQQIICQGNEDAVVWAHIFANPQNFLCLQVIAAQYSSEDREEFLKIHESRFEKLRLHVERIKIGKPLVSATILQQRGIKPSVNMGLLLKEAEKIAINQDLSDPELVLNQLAKNPLWNDS